MSSYNFLKAVGDGLAEAINYRTNLKRRRREEEYDYNKKWERNEQEYQRDLQRGRDEEQWNFDLKQKRTEKERARKEDWLNANSPYYDIQTNDPLSYDIYDARAAINDVPIAAKYREPKNTLSDWKIKEDYKNALAMQRDAARTARGGSGRQPRALSEIEMYQQNPELMKRYWADKRPPHSVKGDKDNFDPFDKTNYYKNIINGLYKEASQIMPPQEVELVKQKIELENTPEEKLSKEDRKKMEEFLEKAFNDSKEESKARMNYLLNQARAWLQQGNNHIQYRTNGKYGMHVNSGNTINLEAEKIADNNVAKNYADTTNSGSDQLLGKAKGMAQSGQNVYPNQPSAPTILYHDNDTPQSLLDASATEQIPESVVPVFEIPADFDDREVISNDLPLDIAMFENNKNYYEMQYRQGRIGQKKYRQIMSWLDGMKKAYDRGEISEEEFIRNLDPFISNQRS